MENPTTTEVTEVVRYCNFDDDHVAKGYMESRIESEKRLISGRARENTLQVFRNHVSENLLDNDTSTELFNEIAEANGWTPVNSVRATYSVVVTMFGEVVAQFDGIEAEDEDDACDKVSTDLSFEVEIGVTTEYNGDTCSETVYPSSWKFDPSEYAEFEATEE